MKMMQMSGGNSLARAGQVYLDTEIQRDFPIHLLKLERHMIFFRAEFINAPNHPNLFSPSCTMTDPNYDSAVTLITDGWKIKFWLKLTFEEMFRALGASGRIRLGAAFRGSATPSDD
jgi:hypothetical protein